MRIRTACGSSESIFIMIIVVLCHYRRLLNRHTNATIIEPSCHNDHISNLSDKPMLDDSLACCLEEMF